MNSTAWIWLKGLLAAAITAGATAVTATVVAPETFNFQDGGTKLLTMVLVQALVGVALYLKSSPLPGEPAAKP